MKNIEHMKVNIIGACQTLGCGRNGVQYGPDSLRNKGLIEKLKQHDIEIIDSGNIHNDDNIVCPPNNKLKNYEKIADFCERLADTVCNSFNNGYFPLVLGGDHSLGIGSVCGAARALGKDNICVIWIDAHTDINTQDTSPTGNVHGMTLASTLGLGCKELSTICGVGAKIKAQNIIYVGSRDIDEGENNIIQKENISVFHMNDIKKHGINAVARQLKETINNLNANCVYMSIDIDVLDPQIAPGTGVPVSNGVNVDQLLKIIDAIVSTGKVIGAELVEVNPTLDTPDNITSIIAVDIINHLVDKVINICNHRKWTLHN